MARPYAHKILITPNFVTAGFGSSFNSFLDVAKNETQCQGLQSNFGIDRVGDF